MAKRVWVPLDVGGLRLYAVMVTFHPPGARDSSRDSRDRKIVAARSPAHAQDLMERIFQEAAGYSCHGMAVKVYQPASWYEDGVELDWGIDATPDGDYALRILRVYRQRCDGLWSDSTTGGKPTSPILIAMNEAQAKRAEELDRAIAKLEQAE